MGQNGYWCGASSHHASVSGRCRPLGSEFGGVLGLRISLRLRLPDDDITLSLLLLLALQGVRSDRTVGVELP